MSYDFKVTKSVFNLQDEVIRLLGQPVRSHSKYNMHACPFHDEQSVGAFKVFEDRYFCFSCGTSGDVLDWLVYVKGKPLSEIMRDHELDFTDDEVKERREKIDSIQAQARKESEAEYVRVLTRLQEEQPWVKYHSNLTDTYRELWLKRGVPEVWQDLWQLGYNPSFRYRSKQGYLTTPSITIPIMSTDGQCLNIQHRLQNAVDGERYRPEGFDGLRMIHPFICNTDLEDAKDYIVVEGAIKAMITYLTLDKPGTQVIGVLSKGFMKQNILELKGKNILVIPDPGGREEIKGTCRTVRARMLNLPDKVDDYILEHDLDKEWLRGVIRQARYV